MRKDPPMRQAHYNEIIRGLGIAMAEFRKIEPTEDKAEEAFRSFVVNHYIPVWLKIE